jgi:hypothetical protein
MYKTVKLNSRFSTILIPLKHEGRERHNAEDIPRRSSVRQFLPHKIKRASGILIFIIHIGQQVLRNNVDIPHGILIF